jgi:hypothetical protein
MTKAKEIETKMPDLAPLTKLSSVSKKAQYRPPD